MEANYRFFKNLDKRNVTRKKSLLCLLFTVFLLSVAEAQKPEEFLVGAAAAAINPADPVFLAGYKQNRKSTGIHDNLYAKAVVISNNDNAVAIVSIDCIGLPYPLVRRIRDMVETRIPKTDFNTDRIIVSSTHTHSAPDVIGLWGEDMRHSGTDSTYIELLVRTAADVVVKAWKKKRLAVARYATTTFGEGWVENVSESAELDREVSILQFVNRKGKNIVSLVNFACHPTFLDTENTLVSADFPSGFYKKLDKDLGGINLYLQGAIGGWVQPENVSRSFEDAEKKGTALAEAVIAATKKATVSETNTIRHASRLFEVPVSNQNLRNLAMANIIRRDIADGVLTEIVWFSIGDATFVTHPGESSPLYSIESKKLMRNKGPKFVLGLGMDELGYLLKEEFFEPGTKLHAAPYLTSMSPGRDAGRAMMRLITELSEDNQ
ncbi:MAG: neutral/alkaline non-lysosomal ceramidase N-terminal domain-containing protein [Chitinophagaceae bacterium]|nr:neutral/alkaline non-lysosomal ceramidase N-terminal domain-containing protein [Chitinophagaceae bacterium]